jgi:hypothetical protein
VSHPSKKKGDRGEREVVELLKAVFPEARRRVNGEESQDDLPGRDVQGVPGFCVQVNLSAEPRPMPKLKEAISSALQGEIPLAFTRKTVEHSSRAAEPWLVTMTADDFVSILRTKKITLMKFAKESAANPRATLYCVCGETDLQHEHSDDPDSTWCVHPACNCTRFEPFFPKGCAPPRA